MQITLKPWQKSDADELVALCNNINRDYLSNRVPYPYRQEDAQWWFNMVEEHEGKDGIFRAVMAEGKIVGTISVEQKQDVFSKDSEIGYFLLTSQWSKGMMTQAVKEICTLAFEKLDILRISGLVYSPNVASRRVLEKNGFALEGCLKNAVVKNGHIYDLHIYGKQRP